MPDTRSRVDLVAERLVTAIAIGEYLPGARLPPERELAPRLGVARATLREAIARLVDSGLLQTQRGRSGGTIVHEQWPESSTETVRRTLTARAAALRDGIDASARLHGTIARAATERRSDADVTVLHACLDEFRIAPSGRDAQLADARLHEAIAHAAHSATLLRLLHELEATVSISAPAHLWGAPGDGMRDMELRAVTEHDAIVGAIVDRRPDDAERLARQHVGIDQELLDLAIARAGLAPPILTSPVSSAPEGIS